MRFDKNSNSKQKFKKYNIPKDKFIISQSLCFPSFSVQETASMYFNKLLTLDIQKGICDSEMK